MDLFAGGQCPYPHSKQLTLTGVQDDLDIKRASLPAGEFIPPEPSTPFGDPVTHQCLFLAARSAIGWYFDYILERGEQMEMFLPTNLGRCTPNRIAAYIGIASHHFHISMLDDWLKSGTIDERFNNEVNRALRLTNVNVGRTDDDGIFLPTKNLRDYLEGGLQTSGDSIWGFAGMAPSLYLHRYRMWPSIEETNRLLPIVHASRTKLASSWVGAMSAFNAEALLHYLEIDTGPGSAYMFRAYDHRKFNFIGPRNDESLSMKQGLYRKIRKNVKGKLHLFNPKLYFGCPFLTAKHSDGTPVAVTEKRMFLTAGKRFFSPAVAQCRRPIFPIRKWWMEH